MSDEAFADLKQALEDALAFERGERRGLKVTRIQGSRPPILSRKVAIREKLTTPALEPERKKDRSCNRSD